MPLPHRTRNAGRSAGMTLVELLVTLSVLGVIFLVVTSILLSSNRVHAKTSRRVEVQASARQGLSLMSTELRQAGADPADPPIGINAIVTANDTLLRVRADLNADGVLQTTEPSEDVTYIYRAGQQSILRDPGTGAVELIPNVTGMTLTYFDETNAVIGPTPLSAADRARVRAIGLSITAEEQDSRPITLTTRITLRNI